MAEKILVIGAAALGAKAASRCRRLDGDAEITMIDEGEYISFGACGLPYYVSGEVQNIDSLRMTNAGSIRDPEFFRSLKGVETMNRTRALSIDRVKKTVLVEDLRTGEKRELPYDKLVLATGARPRVPDVPGADLGGVFTLTQMEAAARVRDMCSGGKVSDAVVVGGGFIGLEAAVALADMWDIRVHVIEMMDQLLPGALSPTLAQIARHDLEKHKVAVHTSEKVLRIEGRDGAAARVVTDKREIDAQLVIFSAGFIPNSSLARDAGLDVAPFGGIVVDRHMRTSDPSIYAGGDCAATLNILTGRLGYLPLGSIANRQGRVIGSNLAGVEETFPGYVGTWAVKLFDMSFAGVGLTPAAARRAGFDAIGVSVEQHDRAHFYPENNNMMTLEIVADRSNSRVLGFQGACADGDAIKARIDAVAGVLQYARPLLEDISNLEVAYAPPFSGALDGVNVAANVAENVISGRFSMITPEEFLALWADRASNGHFFIDMRPAKAGKKLEARFPDWHSIPLEDLKEKLKDIPRDRPVTLICNSGTRAYEGAMYMVQHGFTNVADSMGGMTTIRKMGLEP